MDDLSYPKLFEQCVQAYKLLYAESSDPEEIGIDIGNAEPYRVFRGSITRIIYNVKDVNSGNYSRLMTRLKEMGCIELVERGSGTIPSVVHLHFAPDYQRYTRAKGQHTKGKKKERQLEEQIIALSARLARLEVRVNRIDGRVAAPIEIEELDSHEDS